MGLVVLLVKLAIEVLLVERVSPVQRASQGLLALPVRLVQQVLAEILVTMAILEQLVLKVPKESPVTVVFLARLVLLARLVSKDSVVPMVTKDQMAFQVHQDYKEILDSKDLMERLVTQANLGSLVAKVCVVSVATKEIKE